MLLATLGLFTVMLGQSTPNIEAPAPRKIVLDTDIGDDIDDIYALALAATQKQVKLLGVTTAFGETPKRAQLAAKFLKVIGRGEVPVYAGRVGEHKILRQYDWVQGFQSKSLKRESAVSFLKRTIEQNPGEVTLIAVGPLTNMGDLLTQHPEIKSKIKQIVIMGGGVYVGYNNRPPLVPEWNIRCDPSAAKIVYQSGVPLVMAGLEATTMLQFDAERQKRLFGLGIPLTDALAALTNLWGNNIPTLFDPMAVAYGMGFKFCEEERQHVEVDDNGITRITPGTPNVTVLVKPRKEEFLDWHITALKPQQR